jgi:hypothetical protein
MTNKPQVTQTIADPTPEMMLAGRTAVIDHLGDKLGDANPSDLAAAIYRAMIEARPVQEDHDLKFPAGSQ